MNSFVVKYIHEFFIFHNYCIKFANQRFVDGRMLPWLFLQLFGSFTQSVNVTLENSRKIQNEKQLTSISSYLMNLICDLT